MYVYMYFKKLWPQQGLQGTFFRKNNQFSSVSTTQIEQG